MKERTIFIGVLLTWVLVILGVVAAQQLDFMPDLASSRALMVDRLFRIMIGIATVIFLIVEGGLVYAAIRFRRRPDDDSDALPIHGNNTLELVWTLVPAVIVLFVGIYAFNVLTEIEEVDPDQIVIDVVARQFSWEFNYPEQGLTSSTLHLPVGQQARLRITSADVIHSFWVPNFLAKQDATPGMESELLITPIELGRYPVRCAELCGAGHASMVTEVIVESEEDFNLWIEQLLSVPDDPIEYGRLLFTEFGCNACHTLADAGSEGLIGPPLDDIASVSLERAPDMEPALYIEESIRDPNAFIVPGFQSNLMPQDLGQRMSDEQIEVIVNYLLSQ